MYTAKSEERETNPTENYYYSLDLKRIDSTDPGKSHDYLIVFYNSCQCEIHDSSKF